MAQATQFPAAERQWLLTLPRIGPTVVERLEQAGYANARVNDMAGLWAHPQLAARQRWRTVDTPAGEVQALLPPGVNSAFDYRMDPIPAVGQHNAAILAELGWEGFRTLGRDLAQANTLAAHNLRGAVMASGRAYIDFALSNPGVFRVMFRPETCDPARFPAVQAAGQAAQATLVELVSMVHGTQTSPALCMVYWAHVHGMASLLLDGSLGQECPAGPLRDTLLDEVSNTFANLVFGSAQQPLGELTPPGNR